MFTPLASVPDSLLDAALDRLLPGGDGWPAAGALGLGAVVRTQGARVPVQSAAVRAALSALPTGFADQPAPAQDDALRAVEQAAPADFAALVAAAYSAYYADPRVHAVIAEKSGAPVRPPQPEGHVLPNFDESLLAGVKARGPIWRPV